ncbi:uncharacterized protein UV8b_00646 [Ustilaginoidea virens]|uniref:ERCC1-like central domain-containing protein n=1 Tax=Ustilaginoidea virens TaxID=1159556 RepID=A0A063BW41_USTVR|nr:uncharacterized protein UV8b_00646 [Ustilaginoidea virens]QUC16405.1 hypothetical protein UV8b_00646 [Ustilaginoidea virens]GAO13374.1 hypothetical protein UVI_02013840 [Ustilaginoidea virens]
MDDDYGADDALLAAMAATDPTQPARRTVQQPAPQKIQRPIPMPQRLDKAPPASSSGAKIVQPTPQALPQAQPGLPTILVSPRQRGNPVLACIRSMPWEYSDIPADYVLGLTTCALFLSLKYHRLHPEYIYGRIRNLQGKYNLRVLLTMVDITNHEDCLRELSKTSLVNNVTIILCWSAAEAGRYLELYKSYENAGFAAIRGQPASTYAERLVEFVTVPRSLNKSDAVALVANFGSLQNAINAEPEQLGLISGWGGIKVKRWTAAIEEPFRAKKAAKRGLQASKHAQAASPASLDDTERISRVEQALPLSRVPLGGMPPPINKDSGESCARATPDGGTPTGTAPRQFRFLDEGDDDVEHGLHAQKAPPTATVQDSSNDLQQTGGSISNIGQTPRVPRATGAEDDDALSSGVAEALAKLRQKA